MPDEQPDPTRWKRRITLFSTILLTSLGLCGANFFAVFRFVPLVGPGPRLGQPMPSEWPGRILFLTGVSELFAIAVSAVGLLYCLWQSYRE